MNQLVPILADHIPALIAAGGEKRSCALSFSRLREKVSREA